MMDLGVLRDHWKRHGKRRTLLVYTFKALKRFADFDVMRVVTFEPDPLVPVPCIEPYTTRQITAGEYESGIRCLSGGEEAHARRWAFERGDRCFASFLGDQLVGYTFFATLSTIHRDELIVAFPAGYTYAYASHTDPAHRGKKLSPARATTRRLVDQANRVKRTVMWFVSVDNSPSLASESPHAPEVLGHLAYLRSGRRFLCWASSGCRAAGIGLVSRGTLREPAQ